MTICFLEESPSSLNKIQKFLVFDQLRNQIKNEELISAQRSLVN